MTDAAVLGPLIVFRSKPRHRELNRRNSTGFHRRAPHPLLDILMLVLAIKLSQGGEHASNFTISERKYKYKHLHNYEKTGSTLWCLTEFRRYFLTVPRKPPPKSPQLHNRPFCLPECWNKIHRAAYPPYSVHGDLVYSSRIERGRTISFYLSQGRKIHKGSMPLSSREDGYCIA